MHLVVAYLSLASTFKVAPFARAPHQRRLEGIVQDVLAYRQDGAPLPARILGHEALHVPLAKWPMLIADNCRCLGPDGTVVSIAQAVHADLDRGARNLNNSQQRLALYGVRKPYKT